MGYVDSVMSPFPVIRFKEDKGEIAVLREKEKGDWKKLTLEEKSPVPGIFLPNPGRSGGTHWRVEINIGCVLISVSVGLWGYLWMKAYVYPPSPETITNEEKMKAQIDRMIAMRVNPFEGLTSNYDYDKGEWKKN